MAVDQGVAGAVFPVLVPGNGLKWEARTGVSIPGGRVRRIWRAGIQPAMTAGPSLT